jgi:hypothetical protein
MADSTDRPQAPDVDPNGVPWDFPGDMDTSGWLEEMPDLQSTYEDTVSRLWKKGKNDRTAYDAFHDQLAALIKHVTPNGRSNNNTGRYLRCIHYRLFAKFYGRDLAPYVDPKKRDGPVCPKDHLELLTTAAHEIEKQPGIYESAEWAARYAPVVANLGWEKLRVEEVPGTTALGLLQNAVKDMPGFYEKVLSKYTQKPKDKGKATFKDDGSEQIDYATRLGKRVRKRGAT